MKIDSARLDCIVFYDSSAVLAAFESFTFQSKALLDVLARLVATRYGGAPQGFNKRRQDPGGQFIQAMQKAPSTKGPGRDGLLTRLGADKARWIDDLVTIRDAVTHRGSPGNVVGYWSFLPAGGSSSAMTDDDVHEPLILRQNGTEIAVAEFIRVALDSLISLSATFRDAVFPPAEREAVLAESSDAGT